MNETSSSGAVRRRQEMPVAAALRVLAAERGDAIVVTTMGATREWPLLSQHPLDFHYLPSAMGGGPPLALGLALAQPSRHIIALVGDGSLLMNFGTLVTLRAAAAENLTLVLLDNGVYEVTGAQATPAAGIVLDYAEVARACRWPTAASFFDLETWQADCARLLRAAGPRFLALRVAPVTQDVVPPSPGPIVPRMAVLRAALGVRGAG